MRETAEDSGARTMGCEGSGGEALRCSRHMEALREDVQGHAIPCGHFLPEEEPDQTAIALLNFLKAQGVMATTEENSADLVPGWVSVRAGSGRP